MKTRRRLYQTILAPVLICNLYVPFSLANHNLPEGTILIEHDEQPNITDLIARQINGLSERNLSSTTDADEKGGSFSPNGTRLVFYSNRHDLIGRRSDLYVMDSWDKDGDGHGDNCTRLTQDVDIKNREAFDPAWAPSDNKIVFSSNLANENFYHLYTINPDGSGRALLTNSPNQDLSPSWSPNGNVVAFSRGFGTSQEIYTVEVNNPGNLTKLTNNTLVDSGPVWKTNTTIIFYRFVSTVNNFDLIEIDINTKQETNLTNSSLDSEAFPIVAPDGIHLLSTIMLGSGVDPTRLLLSHLDFSNLTYLTGQNTRDIASDWGLTTLPLPSIPGPGLGSCSY